MHDYVRCVYYGHNTTDSADCGDRINFAKCTNIAQLVFDEAAFKQLNKSCDYKTFLRCCFVLNFIKQTVIEIEIDRKIVKPLTICTMFLICTAYGSWQPLPFICFAIYLSVRSYFLLYSSRFWRCVKKAILWIYSIYLIRMRQNVQIHNYAIR